MKKQSRRLVSFEVKSDNDCIADKILRTRHIIISGYLSDGERYHFGFSCNSATTSKELMSWFKVFMKKNLITY